MDGVLHLLLQQKRGYLIFLQHSFYRNRTKNHRNKYYMGGISYVIMVGKERISNGFGDPR